MTTRHSVRVRHQRFHGRVFDLVSDSVSMPDGSYAERDYLVHPGAVGVVAVDDEDRVVLVEQYRHPVGARLWELPAGLLDTHGESPRQTAQRELAEEAAIVAGRWDLLADVHTTPGCSNEVLRIYLARQLTPVTPAPVRSRSDEEAEIAVRRFPLPVAVQMVGQGEITNATCMIGVLLAARLAQAGWPTPPADEPPLPDRVLVPVADDRPDDSPPPQVR